MSSLPSIPDLLSTEVAEPYVTSAPKFDEEEGTAPAALDTPVRDILWLAPTVTEDISVSQVLARMVVSKTSVMVVVDDEYRPTGVVTPSSLLETLARHYRESDLSTLHALDASKPDGAMLTDDATLACAARLLRATGREHTLIVSREGRFVGVVSALDVMIALSPSDAH